LKRSELAGRRVENGGLVAVSEHLPYLTFGGEPPNVPFHFSLNKRNSLQTLLQTGFQVLVDISIQHLVAVAALDARAQILDARGIEHVRADLVAPTDIRLGVFQRLRRCVAFLHLQLVQPGPQHFHGGVLVGVLGTFVLAGHHGVGRYVGDTYRRVGGVYVLTTRTGGAVGVDAQVGRVDLDFDVVVDFRRDEHRGKRGVPTVARVIGALAHQAMHAAFGAQPAKGVFALDIQGRALDTGDFA